jgi:hypothetical protein
MVINEPEGFTVRKQVNRKGKKVMRRVDMRNGVAYLFRYRDVSLAANSRYLTALVAADNSSGSIVRERKSVKLVIPLPLKAFRFPLTAVMWHCINRSITISTFGCSILDEAFLSRFTFDPGVDNFPIWSPDGRRIAFGSSRKGAYDLYWKAVTGPATEELLLTSAQDKSQSDWSRDGQFLRVNCRRRQFRYAPPFITMSVGAY